MRLRPRALSRRQFVADAYWMAFGAVVWGMPLNASATAPPGLDVAYAGSMSSLVEGPLKLAAAKALNLDLRGRAQGSNALAQLIVGGNIRPDVFIPITPAPAMLVLRSGKAEFAQSIARTEMVIAYSPKSRFAPQFDAAAAGRMNWVDVLQQPGLRFGRTDPLTDPQGRNIIFVVMLAAQLYKQPDLVTRILGPTINEQQIFSESTVEARLQSGELDAASAYKVQPGTFNLPYITLPKAINLSGDSVREHHPDLALTIGGETYRPEPLVYYSVVLKDARNSSGAAAFAKWLNESDAQAVFRRYCYDPPGLAASLHR
jgi:molybdate/tungstate transport system substrate-binding protein